MRLTGVPKWSYFQAQREGPGEAVIKLIAPPFRFIDNAFKDIRDFLQDKMDLKDVRTAQSVPWVGKLFFWWFGGGSEKDKKKKKSKRIKLA